MSEERPDTRSSANLTVTHETTATTTTASLSESQKMLMHMDNVFNKIIKKHSNLKVMIVAKNERFLKSNYARALQCSACILEFTDKVQLLWQKLFPDEPVEHVRIKGQKDEIFVSFDEILEIG
ncbi:hypothetical protein PVAND_010183 [Polypedilum vanderplanki]|uniref:Uncharacterized protein n=1 Tax=Polypedilum vanderplanki TaxID=319348 RepID=A0A9J6CFX4_POLVA|nr:hypothetical protein PVAND_010183 [Polypedilum vanderplanki]